MQIKKSASASLENKNFTFLLMGFVFVLSVCFVAFEWTDKDVTKYEVTNDDIFFEEEIEIQQTTQDVTPPPPAPPVQEVEAFTIVENDVETEHIDIQTEDKADEAVVVAPPVEAPIEEEEEEVETVFVIVENMPEFPGGTERLFKYLSENLKYPVIAQENGIQGRAICQFVVNRDGSIVDVVVVRSAGDASLDKEAIRVIKSMPKWNPGKQRGKAVRVKYTLPVSFKLQ